MLVALTSTARADSTASDSHLSQKYQSPQVIEGDGVKFIDRRRARQKYVKSVEDFYDHVLSHIERAVEISLELKRLHPDRYSDVDPELLRVFMSRHDFAKTEIDPKTGRRRFLEGLYHQYGKDFDALSPAEKALAENDREQLNARDAEHAFKFFKVYNFNDRFIDKSGKYTPLAEKYLEIERVADKVDRGLSPVSAEEFNRRRMKLASVYIDNPVEKALAESLEKSHSYGALSPYEYATKGHSFEEFRARKARYANASSTCVINQIIEKILVREAKLPVLH